MPARKLIAMFLLVLLALGASPLACYADGGEPGLAAAGFPAGSADASETESPLAAGAAARSGAASLSKAKVVLTTTKYSYNGAYRKPKPKVVLDGKQLKRGRDYTLSYKNNKKVGLATVVAKGVRERGYTGSAETTFKIVPKKGALASVKSPAGARITARAVKSTGAKGYQFRIATDKRMTKSVKKALSPKRAHTFKGLKQGRKYYVQTRAYALVNGVKTWGKWSSAKSVTVKWTPKWILDGGYYKYRKTNGKLAHGLVKIDGETYYFDASGRQRTGWQNVGDSYRFFDPWMGPSSTMAKNRVVNGIYVNGEGVAQPSVAGWAELDIMCKAQRLVETLTVPTQSSYEKLAAGFYYIRNDCVESLTRDFSYYDGWHRAMALDVFDGATGSCFSYGAAFAYYANAIGYESCVIVSSGGHGWAEVDGLVYDPEWSRHCGRDIMGVSYADSGGSLPAYGSNRAYVVQVAPNANTW